MNKRLFSVLGLGILALLVLTSFASAAVTFGTAPTLSAGSTSFTISATSDTTESVTFTVDSISDGSGHTIAFTPVTAQPVPFTGNTVTLEFNYEIPSNFVFKSGVPYTTTIKGGSVTKALAFENEPKDISSCKVTGASNVVNHLEVSIDDIKVTNGYGEDNDWYPLDEIEVKVLVENAGSSDDIKSIALKWGLYDVDAKKFIIDGKESNFNLKDGDDETVKIAFTLNENIDDFSDGNYKFYVWATGTDKEYDNKTCTSDSNDITMNIDSNFVVLDSLEITGTASCGNEVQLTGTAWNIGGDDESDVYLKVVNSALGINQKVTLGDIDSLENQDFSFNLAIPADAADGKAYPLQVYVYDEDNDIFENDNNDEAKFNVELTIPSGSCSTSPSFLVTATALSTAEAGQELDVKATVTNTGSKTATVSLSLGDYSDWASLESIDKTSLTLNAGASQDILIKLKLNSDASGTQSFNVIVKEGTKTVTQPVSISVEQSSSLPGITGLFSGSGNLYLYGIAALNILLVLIIIIVAVRVVRKKGE